MVRIKEIIRELERFAPLSLQESFDNAGLQVGDVNQMATGVLLCLDVTEEVIDEAIERECNLIVSHHPLAFRPFKSLTGRNYVERCLIKACKYDLVVYSAHTNLDNAAGGVNFRFAEMIGLENVRVLKPMNGLLLKLVTFVPVAYEETVRNALFAAGAGSIGDYDSCSFRVGGTGTFRAGEGCQPFRGEIGETHSEPEARLEVVVPRHLKEAVAGALLATHPYEEPVMDFYALDNAWNQVGSAVVGELPAEDDERDFLLRIKEIFHVERLCHSPFTGRPVREVAVCGGSGAFLINDAIAYGADVFITGEAKYNDFYDVEDRILLATIGHYESEVCTKEIFYRIISKKFPNFAVHFSNVNSNPVKYL